MALLKRRETSNTQRIKKVFLKKLQVKIQRIFKKKWKRDVYCLKQSSNHTMNSRIFFLKKNAEEVQFQQNLYSLSLSIVHITHKGTAFQILLLLQLPNSLANTQTTKSRYLESPKRQNTNHQNYLATIQCSKNDKLTPRYFCTSTSFKDFPLCCLNLFQCYCPYERQNPLKTS